MRLTPAAASASTLNFDSLPRRGSPPGVTDCSGSHCLIEPLRKKVLVALSTSSPPTAARPLLSGSFFTSGVALQAARADTNARDTQLHTSRLMISSKFGTFPPKPEWQWDTMEKAWATQVPLHGGECQALLIDAVRRGSPL